MHFIDGHRQYSWLGQRVHVYRQNEKEKLTLYSLPYGEVKDISKMTAIMEADPLFKGCKINCIINCSYFDMRSGTNEIMGRYQGINCNEATFGPGEEKFVGWNRTTDKSYMDCIIDINGDIYAGDMCSYDHRDDFMVGFAPAGVQLLDGKNRNLYSPACGYAKIVNANTQTLLIKDDQGRFAFACCDGRLSPVELRNFTRSYGATFQACLDSGGSTQMVVEGRPVIHTGRDLPNFLVFYEVIEEEEPEIEPVPEKPELDPSMTSAVICVKGTLDDGTKYPTRATIDSDWDRNSYFINVGDIVIFEDVKPIPGKPDSYFQIVDGERPDLIGRWFAYDKDYFD